MTTEWRSAPQDDHPRYGIGRYSEGRRERRRAPFHRGRADKNANFEVFEESASLPIGFEASQAASEASQPARKGSFLLSFRPLAEEIALVAAGRSYACGDERPSKT